LLAGSLTAFSADKTNPLAGTYAGLVKEDRATLVLKPDGAAIARPEADGNAVLRGTWEAKGGRVICQLKDPNGGEGQVNLRVDGGDLILESVINPDGNEQQFSPPLFTRQKDGPKGKAPVGAYVGKHDGDELRVELKANGRLMVKPADAEAVMLGEWKRGKKAGTLELAVDSDNGLVRVTAKLGEAGIQMLRIEKPDGDVEEFTEARLKRVKKDAAAPPKGVAKNLVDQWKGIVKEDEIVMQLKADGTAVVVEDENELPGKWKFADGDLVVRVEVEGQVAAAHFVIDGAGLILTKVVEPDGGEETFDPPRLRQTDALGKKKFAGIYEGEVDESDVKLTLEANGKVVAEVVECGELQTHVGKWMAKGALVLVSTEANVHAQFRAAGKDLLLVRFQSPDGEVEEYEPRFRRKK